MTRPHKRIKPSFLLTSQRITACFLYSITLLIIILIFIFLTLYEYGGGGEEEKNEFAIDMTITKDMVITNSTLYKDTI